VSYALDAARARREDAKAAGHGFADCVAHALYAPLYLAGPIISFDAFRDAQGAAPGPLGASYGLRTALLGLFLEGLLRRCPAFALGVSGAFRSLEPVDAAAFAFVTVNVLWLKRSPGRMHQVLTAIPRHASRGLSGNGPPTRPRRAPMSFPRFAVVWRVARAWARADGVDPPENMGRFVCDTFTAAGFWRSWHACLCCVLNPRRASRAAAGPTTSG